MSVSSTARKEQFTLNQSTSTFTFTFRALTAAPTDIKCVVTTGSTDKLLTYTTDYTVAVDADGVGGVVTLVSPTTLSKGTLTVYRETTNKQESDYEDYSQFPANTLENDIDIRTLVSQEQSEELDRTIKLPVSSTLTDLELPTPSAGKALKWNATEDSLENTDVDIDDAITAAASSATVALDASSVAGSHATTAGVHATTANSSATVATSESTNATAKSAIATSEATTAGLKSAIATSETTTAVSASAAALVRATTATSSATVATSEATTAILGATTAASSATVATSHATTAGIQATTASTQALAAASSATVAVNAAASVPVVVKGTFSNTPISTGTMTITYSTIATPYIKMMVVADSNGTILIPDDVTFLQSHCTLDMTSFVPIAGTYSYMFF